MPEPDSNDDHRIAAVVLLEDRQPEFALHTVDRQASARLVADGPGLAAEGGGIVLGRPAPAEGPSVRPVLTITIPAGPVNGLDGWFVLTVGSAGAGGFEVHGVRSAGTGPATVVILDVGSGDRLDGRWSYSRRPEPRSVTVFDEFTEESRSATVFHSAEFSELIVEPERGQESGDRVAVRFPIPSWALDLSGPADVCEQVFHRFATEADHDPVWPRSLLEADSLDRVLSDVESDVEAARSTTVVISVTVRTNTGEVTRGDRLKPLVRYPISVAEPGGVPQAAVLGCSVS